MVVIVLHLLAEEGEDTAEMVDMHQIVDRVREEEGEEDMVEEPMGLMEHIHVAVEGEDTLHVEDLLHQKPIQVLYRGVVAVVEVMEMVVMDDNLEVMELEVAVKHLEEMAFVLFNIMDNKKKEEGTIRSPLLISHNNLHQSL